MTTAAATLPRADTRPAPAWRSYRFELIKLLAQWPIRLALIACWLGPALIVAVISQQSSLPADTVFGRWMSQTGWAGPLVVLAFSCSWILPLLTSLVAGDVFATEDRLGTWRHLLVAVRSRRRIFAAKALASLTIIILLAAGLAASGIVGGLAAAGNRPLVGLDGHLLAPGQAATAVLLAWASVLAPTLAFAAVGLLGSVALGRSPMGLVMPALLALLMQIAQLLPLPVVVRVALPSYAFIAWRRAVHRPAPDRPACHWHRRQPRLGGGRLRAGLPALHAPRLHRPGVRRDPAAAFSWELCCHWSALFAVTAGVIAGTTPASGSGIDKAKLDRSLETAFAHLYRMQTGELHRPDVTEAQLRTSASCDKGGPLVEDLGPGNDWRCVVTWQLPGSAATGSAVYQLDVHPDGRYVGDGDGPQEVNGFFQVHTPTGDAPNPLWQFDGSIDLLTAISPR